MSEELQDLPAKYLRFGGHTYYTGKWYRVLRCIIDPYWSNGRCHCG